MKLIIWGVITLVSIILAFICYKWLTNVARFENRKKEIALGMLTCVLAISSFMFLPVLFSGTDLHKMGSELFDQIQFAEFGAEDSGVKLAFPPFLRKFSHVLALGNQKSISVLLITIPIVASLVVIIFVLLTILKIREAKKKECEEYNRKHLFEYNSQILTKLNN